MSARFQHFENCINSVFEFYNTGSSHFGRAGRMRLLKSLFSTKWKAALCQRSMTTFLESRAFCTLWQICKNLVRALWQSSLCCFVLHEVSHNSWPALEVQEWTKNFLRWRTLLSRIVDFETRKNKEFFLISNNTVCGNDKYIDTA